jgi:hypothetical protein
MQEDVWILILGHQSEGHLPAGDRTLLCYRYLCVARAVFKGLCEPPVLPPVSLPLAFHRFITWPVPSYQVIDAVTVTDFTRPSGPNSTLEDALPDLFAKDSTSLFVFAAAELSRFVLLRSVTFGIAPHWYCGSVKEDRCQPNRK